MATNESLLKKINEMLDALDSERQWLTQSNLYNLDNSVEMQHQERLIYEQVEFWNQIKGIATSKNSFVEISIPHSFDEQTTSDALGVIWDLENLRRLKIVHRRIELPNKIGQLEKLEELTLSDCDLDSLPQQIGKLTNLKILSLENNKLTNVPIEIGNLLIFEKGKSINRARLL